MFAHEAKAVGKSVLIIEKRPNIAGNIALSIKGFIKLLSTIYGN